MQKTRSNNTDMDECHIRKAVASELSPQEIDALTRATIDGFGSANESNIGKLSPAELDLIERVRKEYNSLIRVNCTSCRYCMPCPNNVDIPELFGIYNEAAMFETWKPMKNRPGNPRTKKPASSIVCNVENVKTLVPNLSQFLKKLKEIEQALASPS